MGLRGSPERGMPRIPGNKLLRSIALKLEASGWPRLRSMTRLLR